jgi:hypothetical protein
MSLENGENATSETIWEKFKPTTQIRDLNLPRKGAPKSKQNLHMQNNITEEDLKHALVPPLK